ENVACASQSLAAPRGDEVVDPSAEYRQRQSAAAEHLVVKRPQIEGVPELAMSLVAEPNDLEHADHVRRSLTRPYDVAPHFGADLPVRGGRIRREVSDGLLLGPAHRMQPGIH